MFKTLALWAAVGLTCSTIGLQKLSAQTMLHQSLNEIVTLAQININQAKVDNQYWNMPAHIGSIYASKYYLFNQYIGQGDLFSAGRQDQLKQLILNEQRVDGSWAALEGANRNSGELSASVIHYWTLKSMGTDLDSEIMRKARGFILSQGGVEAAPLFTRIFLALFRAYPWNSLPSIPAFIFTKSPFGNQVNESQFAQWVRPHLLPISFLKAHQVSKDLGSNFLVWELFKNGKNTVVPMPRDSQITHRDLIRKMLSRQHPIGSWGGYTLATMLTSVALDYSLELPMAEPQMQSQLQQSLKRASSYLESQSRWQGKNVLNGWACDGRYWDTALLTSALLESGFPVNQLTESFEYLISTQSKNAGFSFGLGFETYPDLDDTAEIILALHATEWRDPKTFQWIQSMQNSDGGWAAFDKNNVGNALLKRFAGAFSDSADLFDESSADVTGHVLEALGTWGYNLDNSKMVRRAVSYLRNSWNTHGPWRGRWGVNTIYGTGAALVGLMRVGVPNTDALVASALGWLQQIQNSDGGFGETYLSDAKPELRGKGVSTPTQTAWALLAFIEAGELNLPNLQTGLSYLVQDFQANGRWIDQAVVGTGHPGVVI